MDLLEKNRLKAEYKWCYPNKMDNTIKQTSVLFYENMKATRSVDYIGYWLDCCELLVDKIGVDVLDIRKVG